MQKRTLFSLFLSGVVSASSFADPVINDCISHIDDHADRYGNLVLNECKLQDRDMNAVVKYLDEHQTRYLSLSDNELLKKVRPF